MDAISLLTADHNRVRGLFAQFREAHEGNDTEALVEVATKIFEDLEVHMVIEEEIFYPAAHDATKELGEDVDEGIQEHHVVRVLKGELGELEAGSDEWVAKMTVLIENVEHHAEEEEKEMFPSARSSLGAKALDAIADELEVRKRSLGAPVLQDKIDLTKEALLELAKEQQIPGRSKMSHDELAATVAPS